jgi:hypothetical protein
MNYNPFDDEDESEFESIPQFSTVCFELLQECFDAIHTGCLIHRTEANDKEFHFQNWFHDRLTKIASSVDPQGRNLFPDFLLHASNEAYEVKGLEVPGRDNTFDANSHLPSGIFEDKSLFYAFGRYPKTKSKSFPVLDVVICHGSFFNTNRYAHLNTSIPAFGSFGDIAIRDRKMYVIPTPYSLVGPVLDENFSLIVPVNCLPITPTFVEKKRIVRCGTPIRPISYTFDLQYNQMSVETRSNTKISKYEFSLYQIERKMTNK